MSTAGVEFVGSFPSGMPAITPVSPTDAGPPPSLPFPPELSALQAAHSTYPSTPSHYYYPEPNPPPEHKPVYDQYQRQYQPQPTLHYQQHYPDQRPPTSNSPFAYPSPYSGAGDPTSAYPRYAAPPPPLRYPQYTTPSTVPLDQDGRPSLLEPPRPLGAQPPPPQLFYGLQQQYTGSSHPQTTYGPPEHSYEAYAGSTPVSLALTCHLGIRELTFVSSTEHGCLAPQSRALASRLMEQWALASALLRRRDALHFDFGTRVLLHHLSTSLDGSLLVYHRLRRRQRGATRAAHRGAQASSRASSRFRLELIGASCRLGTTQAPRKSQGQQEDHRRSHGGLQLVRGAHRSPHPARSGGRARRPSLGALHLRQLRGRITRVGGKRSWRLHLERRQANLLSQTPQQARRAGRRSHRV